MFGAFAGVVADSAASEVGSNTLEATLFGTVACVIAESAASEVGSGQSSVPNPGGTFSRSQSRSSPRNRSAVSENRISIAKNFYPGSHQNAYPAFAAAEPPAKPPPNAQE